MEWPFELSLMVFLIIAFASNVVDIKTRSRLSLPFALGIICIVGFSTGLFPTEFIVASKMKDVGFIAFNMLIIHSGTMIDFKQLKSQKQSLIIAIIGVLIMSAVIIFGMSPFIGKELGAMSPGPIIGGGAAAAISSISVMQIKPELSVYPWMIFMLQCFFGIPICAFVIRKESNLILNNYRKNKNISKKVNGDMKNNTIVDERSKLCDRIPEKYKTTAYYLGALMIISVFNRWLNVSFVADLGINLNITALIFGIALGQLGIIDRAPLIKSQTMGFLMLGLMALMANTLAHTPIKVIISLIIPILAVFIVATIILVLVGIVASKIYKFSPYKGIMITLNSMVGFPVNLMLVDEASAKLSKNNEEKQVLKMNLNPVLSTGSTVIVNIISIVLASMVTVFI
ncbi:MAG: hypothetical protein RR636_04470 [Clostridium sp.]|uniref:hypothetical protein n=1 Tax=Clostridium sp. TaxID=1506 RepID=UPI003217F166